MTTKAHSKSEAGEKITVKVGLLKQERPLTFSSTQSADEITKLFSTAMEKKSVIHLEDADKHQLIIQGEAITYVMTDTRAPQTIGFTA